MANRKETTADIVVHAGEDIVVERLTVTKEIGVEEIYGSSALLPDSVGITQMSYSGTMTIKGNRKDLEDHFFDSNGVPAVLDAVTITHFDGGGEGYESNGAGGETNYNEVICTNEGYEASAGEVTETTYEFIAMSKDSDQNPTN